MSQSRTHSIAFIALAVALISVCAWITVPLGPVPFTLQTFAVALILLTIKPREVLAAIAIYLLMGAIGLPVFSGMRGGFGMIASTSGGFLWGFLLAGAAGIALRQMLLRAGAKKLSADAITLIAFIIVVYLCGWLQLAFVSGMGLGPAFMAGVAPFALIDAAKMAAALAIAQAIRRALPQLNA